MYRSGMPTSPPTLPRIAEPNFLVALGSGARLGAACGLLVALVDGLDSMLQLPSGLRLVTVLCSFSLVVPLTVAAGAAFGAWLSVASWLGRKSSKQAAVWVTGGFAALPLAAFAVWVPTSWVVDAWRNLGTVSKGVAITTYVVLVAAAIVLGRLTLMTTESYRRCAPKTPRWHWLLVVASVTVAAGAYWADRSVLVGLYEDFHYGLTMCFLLAIAAFVVVLSASIRRPSWLVAGHWSSWIWFVTLAAAFMWVTLNTPPSFKTAPGLVSSKLAGTLRSVSDFDGDGDSNILGGTDCGPFNSALAPGNFDIPENGVDEDCSGTDTAWPSSRPATNGAGLPDFSGYNVLLVSIDALRADHLGAYGYAKNTSPTIDALASESLVFLRAYSQSAKTFNSLPSLFTGLYPSNIPRDYNHPLTKGKKSYIYNVTGDARLLTQHLVKEKYSAAAFSQLGFFRNLGLSRNFKPFKHTREVTARARQFIKQTRQPFFLWMHYLYPHNPYVAHECCDFGEREIDRYDGEIAFTDAEFGRVIAQLKATGRYERTIIIVTADHGEAFGEHGLRFHPRELYEELLHVPLVVRIPGIEPRKVDTIVELVDIAPTLHELLRLRGSLAQFDGQPLPIVKLGDHPSNGGSAYSEVWPETHVRAKSLVTREWRIIVNYDEDTVRLFDTSTNPASSINVALDHPDVVRQLSEQVASRALRRQGLAFSAFAATHDERRFARELRVIRREPLLQEALRRLEPHYSSQAAAGLQRLIDRPGLSAELKQEASRILKTGK